MKNPRESVNRNNDNIKYEWSSQSESKNWVVSSAKLSHVRIESDDAVIYDNMANVEILPQTAHRIVAAVNSTEEVKVVLDRMAAIIEMFANEDLKRNGPGASQDYWRMTVAQARGLK